LADISPLEQLLKDRYRIERVLGRGGMATVFLAHDLKHDRPVALKVLHPELAASLGPERFQREIHFAARLQHPHILSVYDSGETAGQLWFTMPFVEGESLRDRLRRDAQLPVAHAVRIATEGARALDYAHRHGVIHRDIKPENILLTSEGDTLVADFGIARALSAGAASEARGATEARLTETGTSIGTPAYMSPEQASGDKHVDARSDIYSLGVVLYEMLAGEPPFAGPTAQAIIARRFTGEAPKVRQARPSVPASVEQAIACALALTPADRFETAGEFAQTLSSSATPATQAPADAATTALPRGRRARRLPVAAVTLMLGFLVGLGVLFAWRSSHRRIEPIGGRKVVAVLPFENLGDSADAYFAEGVANEIRTKLASIEGLEVIARGSSAEYRNTTKRPEQIARELGADYLLTATVQWAKVPGAPSRVRVSPELVDATPGHRPSTRWGERFDAALTDVFEVQANIATQVAGALNVALGDSTRQALTAKPTENLAAYDAYLKGDGVLAASAYEPGALRAAARHYEQAVALDSTFALAWARIAWVYANMHINGAGATQAGADKAHAAAERAVRLAPNGTEGRQALGDYYRGILKDYPKALAEYEKGHRNSPKNAQLLGDIATTEWSLGRWGAALEHYKQAATLDPRSVRMLTGTATTLQRLRRYPEAIAWYDRALALAPANLSALQDKAMVFLAQGDLARARKMLLETPKGVDPAALVVFMALYFDLYWVLDDEQQELLLRLTPASFDGNRATWGFALAQTWHQRGDSRRSRAYADSARIAIEPLVNDTPDDAQLRALYGVTLAYLDRRAEAVREAQLSVRLSPASRDAYIGPYIQHQLVRTYLLVGEHEKALDQLEPLLRIPYYLTPGWLRIDPEFAPLRGNQRFERLIAAK
jgi:serine/threonine-protein kinase